MKRFPYRAALFLIWVGLIIVGADSAGAVENKATQASLNDGYSLFYNFCDQESKLSLLLWIKTTPPNIANYAKRVSSTAKDDMTILKKFGVGDSALRLDKILTGLPFLGQKQC